MPTPAADSLDASASSQDMGVANLRVSAPASDPNEPQRAQSRAPHGRASVDDELLNIAFSQLPQSLLVSVVVIIVFGVLLWGTFSLALTVGWILVMACVIVARYAMVQSYRRAKAAAALTNAPRDDGSKWQMRFLIGAVASGAVWGVGAALAIAGEGHADLAVVIGAVLVVAIISRLSLGTQIRAQQGFLVAALVPPAIAAWQFAGSTGRMVSLILFVGVAISVVASRRIYEAARALLETRTELELTRDLAQAARAKAQFWELVEWAPESINVTIDGVIRYANPACVKLYGASHVSEIIGREVITAVHPESRAVVEKRLEELGPVGSELPPIELKCLRPNGEVFTVESRVRRITFDGQVASLVLQRDITARRDAEAAVADYRERTQRLLKAASVGLWDWNIVSGTVFFSPEWKANLGYADHEVKNEFAEWQSRMHPDDLPAVMQQIDAFKVGKLATYEAEFRMRHRDGSWRWFLSRADIVRDALGAAVVMSGSLLDVTQRKLAEETSKALEEQLRESQKMQAIGTLAGGIAHDFNNIIAAILGNADLAMRAVKDQVTGAQLEQIQQAGRRGRDLVQQILSFSRRTPSQKARIDIARVIAESVKMLKVTFPARVHLEVECAQALPSVMADATQVQQVIVNLANNAMQAIGEHNGRVRISLNRIDVGIGLVEGQPRNVGLRQMYDRNCTTALCLSVCDTGEGMTPEVLDRMFEPFFTTRAVDQGTGLGLSVVLGIVQAHDGAILVNSRRGEGTEFCVLLPLDENRDRNGADVPLTVSATNAPQAAANVGRSAVAQISSAAAHIMYVDDDEALVSLVDELLRSAGYRVSSFSNPAKALAAFRADPAGIDLVVTDYNMPQMSGIELARELRALRPDIRIAIASGYVNESLRRQADEVNVAHLLPKVVAIESLGAEVAKILRC